MKDPLRYFLDEGFGVMYSFINESGILEARMSWITGTNFVPVIKTQGAITTITIGGRSYITNDYFMKNYTISVDDRNHAEELINTRLEVFADVKKCMEEIHFVE